MKPSESLYQKYEYLAVKYANKIHSYEQLAYEYDDLLQEFKIKIFLSIKAYGKRWAKYRRGEASKPVPIKYYLECACGNKMRDFMKLITRENYKTSIDDINFDCGMLNSSTIDCESNSFIINDVDLLEGLKGKERVAFSLYLRGYNTRFIYKVYVGGKHKKETTECVKKVIEMQKKYIIDNYGNDLLQSVRIFKTCKLED